MPAKSLVLIDGSGYIFRAFFALPPMTRPDGTPVNAVFGFANMLFKLMQDRPHDDLVVVFDYSGESFRNQLYDQYKANRDEPPKELVPQFALVREAARAFGLPVIDVEGFEADDLIAAYAKRAGDIGEPVTVVSSDKDLMQLVADGVAMWDPMKQKAIGRAEVIEKFGVGPELVCDALALIGDTSRQCPGRARHRPEERGPALDRVRLARGPPGQPRPDQAAQAARGAGAERGEGPALLPAGLPRRRSTPAAAAGRAAPQAVRRAGAAPVPAHQRLQVAGGPDRPGRGRGRGHPGRAQGGGRAALRRRHHAGRARRDPGPRRRHRPPGAGYRDHLARRLARQAGGRLPRGRAGRGLLRAPGPCRRFRPAPPRPARPARRDRAAAARAGRPLGAQDRPQHQVRRRRARPLRPGRDPDRRHHAGLLRPGRRQPRPRHGRAGAARPGL